MISVSRRKSARTKRRPRFSFFRFNCQTAHLLNGETERQDLLPGLWPGGQVTRQRREDQRSLRRRLGDNVAAGVAYIVGGSFGCQPRFRKKFKKLGPARERPAISAFAPVSPALPGRAATGFRRAPQLSHFRCASWPAEAASRRLL